MKELPNSRGKSYQEQQALIAVNPSFEVPDLLSQAVCILTHFVKTKVHLFPQEHYRSTYIHCKETWQPRLSDTKFQTVVGWESSSELKFTCSNAAVDEEDVGIAALRKFL